MLLALFLGQVAAEAADEAAPITAAVKKLQHAKNYAWRTVYDMPGAPKKLQLPPVSGKTDARLGTILTGSADGQPMITARKGAATAIKLDGIWKKTAKALKAPNTNAPADELAALLPSLTNLSKAKDSSFKGTLKPEAALAIMRKISQHRKKKPKTSKANGSFKLWLSDGLPTKYELTISAKMSGGFVKFDSKLIQTVEIKDVDSTIVEMPEAVKKLLRGKSAR